jgi:uncharacterized membrane protein YhaH (DUF805 family)
MLAAIKHGLGNLLNFAGRDARQAFWYYVLFVYLVTLAITLVVIVPTMIESIMAGVRQGMAASQAGDSAAAQLAIQAQIAGMMGNTMSTMVGVGLVTQGAVLLLLAAAFVRRLHDSDLSGWWALIPAAIQIADMFVAPAMMRRALAAMTLSAPGDPMAGLSAMQGSMSGAGLLGWTAILIVIALGVRKSTPGPNRFGEAPFTA